MIHAFKRPFLSLTALAAVGLCVSLASTALASQPSGKSTQTEAIWKSFDPEGQTVTVKVKKPGRGKDAKRLKRGKEATFKVKVEGSVLVRTTVSVNGKKGELSEIPEGKTVYVYWRPDEKDPEAMYARKIDVIFSQKELEERWKVAD